MVLATDGLSLDQSILVWWLHLNLILLIQINRLRRSFNFAFLDICLLFSLQIRRFVFYHWLGGVFVLVEELD